MQEKMGKKRARQKAANPANEIFYINVENLFNTFRQPRRREQEDRLLLLPLCTE